MAAKKNIKRFEETKSYKLTIKDDGGVVGKVLLKPNGIGWSEKGAHKYILVEWDVLEPQLETWLAAGQAKELDQ